MSGRTKFKLKKCPKKYTVDQDKATDPMTTVKTALAKLGKTYDLSNVRIQQRKDAVAGAYSYSSLSDQIQASGKGLTPEQSQASAIMEFVERYSWLYFDYEHYDGYTIKCFNEIKAGKIPTVSSHFFLNNFAAYADDKDLRDEICQIPLKWIKGLSLPDYKPFYYPLNWYNYVFSSNGLATGNTIEEAIIQAICELIERENVYQFFEGQRQGNDLNIKSVRDPLVRLTIENAKRKGIELIIKDISFDLGVPTILVCGTKKKDKGKLTYRGCGYGTHTDPTKALIRALSEYFEGFSLMSNFMSQVSADWEAIMSKMPAKNLGFISTYRPQMMTTPGKKIDLKDMPNLSQPDIKDEIESILKILKKFSCQVVIMDKTHPRLKVPVVRAFIPQFRNLIVCEHQWPWWHVAAAYYEAGDEQRSKEYLEKLLGKSSVLIPAIAYMTQPRKIFESDYRKTMLAHFSFKRDSLALLKANEQSLKNFRKYI